MYALLGLLMLPMPLSLVEIAAKKVYNGEYTVFTVPSAFHGHCWHLSELSTA